MLGLLSITIYNLIPSEIEPCVYNIVALLLVGAYLNLCSMPFVPDTALALLPTKEGFR